MEVHSLLRGAGSVIQTSLLLPAKGIYSSSVIIPPASVVLQSSPSKSQPRGDQAEARHGQPSPMPQPLGAQHLAGGGRQRVKMCG